MYFHTYHKYRLHADCVVNTSTTMPDTIPPPKKTNKNVYIIQQYVII